MKDYTFYKSEAIRLRKQGLSYNEIRKQIKIAKSTLSVWLKHVRLKPEQRERLYTKQIQILSFGPQSQKQRRAREIEQIVNEAGNEIKLPLSFETLRLMGACLYWAEGSKSGMLDLTNSDPHLILFFVRWINSVFGISAKEIKARLNIYPQQNELKIKKFWSDLTGIPLQNFGKSYVKPLSKNYKKHNLYYGTMRIEVPRSVNLRHKVFGWVKKVLEDIDKDVKLKQRKWQSLTKVKRPANL